jgi:hypothetical protein
MKNALPPAGRRCPTMATFRGYTGACFRYIPEMILAFLSDLFKVFEFSFKNRGRPPRENPDRCSSFEKLRI